MQKQIGSIFLVAGTCIGSGMIALPMVLAKLGLLPSLFLMLLIWSVMYYTSLINLELNLQAGKGLYLGDLGRLYAGRGAEAVGAISLKLLSYALLAVFIYGGSSILSAMFHSHTLGLKMELTTIESGYALMALLALLLPIKLLDYLNRFLFIALLGTVSILLIGLLSATDWNHIPLFSEHYGQFSAWSAAIPVVFTSFGFQVIFHTLTNYCHKDPKMLKRAFFWGSLLPAVVYILWTSSVLSVVYHDNPLFYQQMAANEVEVGDLILELSRIAKWESIQLLVWWISSLAMLTSVLGVGVGLCDTLKSLLSQKILNEKLRNVTAATLTILPAYVVALLVPNAFIAVLGFAGMILAIIAILLPIYLLSKAKFSFFHYGELKFSWLIGLSALMGALVIACEVYNWF